MAINIKSSGELKDIIKKLTTLKKGFSKHLNKTETNRLANQKIALKGTKEMTKLRDEFERLMTETENQVEQVEAAYLKNVESVTETCNVVIEQINKMTTNLNMLQNKNDNESIFISIKRSENELQSLEESLTKLKSDNTVREYKFEPDEKLKSLLSELNVLGRLVCLPVKHDDSTATRPISSSQEMAKQLTHVMNISVSDILLRYHCSLVLQNEHIVVTDYHNNKVKIIDTNRDMMYSVSDIRLTGSPVSITKVNTNQFAVTLPYENKIQMIILTRIILSIGNEISVNGECYGIAYNSKDQTFIVSFCDSGKVEIINMTGSVLKTIATDSKESKLFSLPYCVALTPDMSGVYVSDADKNSVTLLTLHGDIKAVYKDKRLIYPSGMCVQKSGVVFVVGQGSITVHQLDPVSGKFKLLLDKTDGLHYPWSISYCDVENKMYIGSQYETQLKLFEMK